VNFEREGLFECISLLRRNTMSKFFIRMTAVIIAAGLVLAGCEDLLNGKDDESGNDVFKGT
jgi:hypothetical protein